MNGIHEIATKETENSERGDKPSPRVTLSRLMAAAVQEAVQQCRRAQGEFAAAQQAADEKQKAWQSVGVVHDRLISALVEDAGFTMADFPRFSIEEKNGEVSIIPTPGA
jgi:hypothetical protein